MSMLSEFNYCTFIILVQLILYNKTNIFRDIYSKH